MFADETKECSTEVGGYSSIVGGIIPYDVSLPVIAFGGMKGFFEVEFDIMAAGLKCRFVRWFGFVEQGFVG